MSPSVSDQESVSDDEQVNDKQTVVEEEKEEVKKGELTVQGSERSMKKIC